MGTSCTRLAFLIKNREIDALRWRQKHKVLYKKGICKTQFLVQAKDKSCLFSYNAWRSWDQEFSYFLNNMGCSYAYNTAICDYDPSEDNYEDFLNWDLSR